MRFLSKMWAQNPTKALFFCFFLPFKEFLVFWLFFPSLSEILGRKGQRILVLLVVFLAFSRRSKERKIRFWVSWNHFPTFSHLSVPKNRNRRKIAAFSNRKVQNRKFYCGNSCDFWGRGTKIAAFQRFQIASFSRHRRFPQIVFAKWVRANICRITPSSLILLQQRRHHQLHQQILNEWMNRCNINCRHSVLTNWGFCEFVFLGRTVFF